MTDEVTAGLHALGSTVREPLDHVEVFPAPAGVDEVAFTTDELSSICPVTGQPDISDLEIRYVPNAHCIESKSLKLYLWRFRNMPVFAEALAAEIATEVMTSAAPRSVTVTVTQQPRGGIRLQAISRMGAQ